MLENEGGKGEETWRNGSRKSFHPILSFERFSSSPMLINHPVHDDHATVLFHTFQTVPNCSLKLPVAGQCCQETSRAQRGLILGTENLAS